MNETLEQKILLSDGTRGKIFSKEISDFCNSDSWKSDINCHICRIGRLSELNFYTHVKGKKHRRNLSIRPDAESFRKPLTQKETQLFKSETTKQMMNGGTSNVNRVVSSRDLQAEDETNRAGEFRISFDLEVTKLLKEHKSHKITPENHPMYGTEWKKFWQKRYDQLKREGKVNPDSYNYKDDWAVFWKNRMEEILLEKIEIKKSSLREKLSLPNDLNRRSQVRRRSPEASSYETISSDDEKSKVEYQQSKKRRRFMEFPPCYQHDLSQNNFEPQKHEPLITYENETVSFVTVCRLLSALESDLGSLAANVIELLSKAIALEKAEANKSDELMTTENMLFLETVKEKMKGVLVVNVMPSQKVAAIKRCIQNIAKLIHTTPLINTSETRPSSEDEEKKKLAEKIATALIAQGKKDCTAEELDVLVDIFLINNDDTANKTVQKPETQTSNLEALTNQDFKTLLENFAELENDEQSHIIKYLTDLEEQDPQRLEELRNYVTIDPTVIADGNNNNPAEIDDDSDDYNLVEAISSVIANVESHAERD